MFNSFRASSALFVAPLDLFTASSVSVFLIHHSITPFSIRVRTGVRIPFFPPSFSLSPYLLPSSSCPCASFSTSFLSIKTTVLLFTVHHAKKLRGEWRGRKKERGSKGGRAIISYSLAWTVNSLLLYISSNPPLLPPPHPPFPCTSPFFVRGPRCLRRFFLLSNLAIGPSASPLSPSSPAMYMPR